MALAGIANPRRRPVAESYAKPSSRAPTRGRTPRLRAVPLEAIVGTVDAAVGADPLRKGMVMSAHAAGSVRDPLARALLVMTFSTGLVDAVSYLGLGRVFTANMTGNIVLLGFGIAGSEGLPVLAPLVSLAAFLVGSAVGGRLASTTADRHALHVSRALRIEIGLVLAAAVAAAATDVRPSTPAGDAVIALLALAMGVRNATVRRLGVPDLTTTVLTMTLTGLAAESRIAGGSGQGSVRRITAVLAMFSGALAGALLLEISLVPPLLAAAALALLVALAYIPIARREG